MQEHVTWLFVGHVLMDGNDFDAAFAQRAKDRLQLIFLTGEVTIHNRVDFAASMIDGRTVMELEEGSRSGQECEQLWQYLQNRLKNLARAQGMSTGQAPAGTKSAAAMQAAGEGHGAK